MSYQNDRYIRVIANWINKDFNICKAVLTYKLLSSSHIAKNIKDVLLKIFEY